MPIIFGVLTTDTVAQAIERAEPTKFNRGGEAAKSAIEMATVMRLIRGREAMLQRRPSRRMERELARCEGAEVAHVTHEGS